MFYFEVLFCESPNLDSGHLAAKVEFYPTTVKQAVPIGASILSVLTQDYRLYLYRYRRAHPNYWCELVDIRIVGASRSTSPKRVCPSG